MNIEAIKSVVGRVGGRSLLVLQKHSPEILTTVGIVGVVAASVLGARATLKAQPVVKRLREDVRGIKELRDDDREYASKEYAKDLTYAYSQGALDLLKLYGPALTLGVASIGSIVAAHGIMRRRNVALLAAYKAIETGFQEYRKRVIEEYGEEKDREYRAGIFSEEVTDKDGKKSIEKKYDPNAVSVYARYFDELSTQWQKIPEYNLLFIKAQQNYMNDLLRSRGHVFLNEVYDALGLERSQAGQAVGWVLSEEGDNFVDFGIFDIRNHKGLNPSSSRPDGVFFLDFNVDGVILDKI